MLTEKQNLLETIRGGSPDHLVNQRSYMEALFDPITVGCIGFCGYGETRVTDWGVTVAWLEGTPGQFPVDAPDQRVITDITKWSQQLKAPDPASYTQEMWAPYVEQASKIDRSQRFVACDISQGIFEKMHSFMGMEETLVNLFEEPEHSRDLIDFLVDWEIECAKLQIDMLHPNVLFHCDDFGSQRSLFMSPQTYAEFFVPAYQRLYGFWKDNGVELVVHHSDSYGAPLVPCLIEMGVDIWQGPVVENDLPSLVKQYGGRISFQGGIDNGKFDVEDWSYDKICAHVKQLVQQCGVHYLIPGFTAAGPGTTYDGAYDAATRAINEVSREMFG